MKKLIEIIDKNSYKFWIKKIQIYKTYLPKKILALLFLSAERSNKKWEKDIIDSYHKNLLESKPVQNYKLLNIHKVGECQTNAFFYGKQNKINIAKGFILFCDNDQKMKFENKWIQQPRLVPHTFNIDDNNNVIDCTNLGSPIYLEYRIKEIKNINDFKSKNQVINWANDWPIDLK